MNYVIFGEERLLMDDKLKELKEKYDCSLENLNYASFDMRETPMQDVLHEASELPFLAEYKMVVMEHPYFLTSQKKLTLSDDDVNAFIRFIQSEIDSTILIIFHEGLFDERRKVMKELHKHAKFYKMDKVTYHTVYKVTRESVIKQGCSIDDDALNLLINRVGENLFELSHQVDKLCLYTKHIKKEDIDALVAAPLEENVFALTNAILAHDLNKTMKIYQDLMVTNHEPIALIGLIATSLRNLYEVKLLTRKGYRDNEIAKMTGINPRAIYPIRKNGEKFDTRVLLQKLNELSELDLKIKRGLIDKQRGLELFLIRIVES